MRRNKYFYLALAMTMGLAACNTAEGDDPGAAPTGPLAGSNVVNYAPVQKTKVAFTSNDQDLSKQAILQWQPVTTTAIDINAEKAVCEEMLPEQNGNTENIDIDFLYYAADADMELEFYPVYSQSSTTHNLGVFYYDENGNRHEQIIWEAINPWNLYKTDYLWSEEKKNYTVTTVTGVKITIKKGYKFGFYWNGHGNSGETTYYSKTDLNPAVIATYGSGEKLPGEVDKVHAHAGTFVSGGKTYLGIEDWTDFDYQDLVFTCDKEIPTVPSDEILPTPEDPQPPVVDPDPVDPDPETPVVPEDPADPEVVGNNGSVEINLALNAEHEKGDWAESHLSIHVRDTTDVTVFLPIGAEYYCPADDMMIVQKHDDAYVYNVTAETVSMEINGNVVTLNVKFAKDGITIKTQGINADILKYLRETYNDGLTFEVRNYYNELNRSVLQNILNNTVVSFENAPKIFVNAFGKDTETGVVDPYACTVTPADPNQYNGPDEQDSEYESAKLYIFDRK